MTIAEMRYAFKQRIERNKIVADQIKPTQCPLPRDPRQVQSRRRRRKPSH